MGTSQYVSPQVNVTVSTEDRLPEKLDTETPREHLARCFSVTLDKIQAQAIKMTPDMLMYVASRLDACLYGWICQAGYSVQHIPRADVNYEKLVKNLEAKADALKRVRPPEEELSWNCGGEWMTAEEMALHERIASYRRHQKQNRMMRNCAVVFLGEEGDVYEFDERWDTGCGL